MTPTVQSNQIGHVLLVISQHQVCAQMFVEMEKLCLPVLLQPTEMMATLSMEMVEIVHAQLNLNGLAQEAPFRQLALVWIFVEMVW